MEEIKLISKHQLAPETLRQLKESGLMTVSQYAKKKGLSVWSVQLLCRKKLVPSKKVSGVGNRPWVIFKK